MADTTSADAGNGLKATPHYHRRCGGAIVASLDGETCGRCGAEIASDGDLTTIADPVVAYLSEVGDRADAATPGPWRLEYDSCDCGDGYGCSHGSWPYAFHLPEPHTERSPGEEHPNYDFAYTEVSEFSDATAEFIKDARTNVPRLVAALKAVLDVAATTIPAPCADRIREAISRKLLGGGSDGG